MTNFVGTIHNDSLEGTSSPDEFDISQGGNDTVDAGEYWDTIRVGGALTARDRINGGEGHDILYLEGDYSAGLELTGKVVASVEEIVLLRGHDYDITLSNLSVDDDFYADLQVYGSNLALGDDVRIDGHAVKDHDLYLYGGFGDDTLIGGKAGDTIAGSWGRDVAIGGGGDDLIGLSGAGSTADGGDGDDTLRAGSGLSEQHVILGGRGHDVLEAYGDYSQRAVLGPMSGIETFRLDDGSTSNLDYRFKLTDGFATPDLKGRTLTIDAGGADRVLSIDAIAETDTRLNIVAGGSDAWLRGGALDDTFRIGSAKSEVFGGGGDDLVSFWYFGFDGDHRNDGGAGFDTLELLGSGMEFEHHFGPDTLKSIEEVRFEGSRTLVFDDGNLAEGKILRVQAMGSAFEVVMDGSAETDGRFDMRGSLANPDQGDFGQRDSMVGGAGADTLDGGGERDTIVGDGGADVIIGGWSMDVLTGGSGADRFLYREFQDTGARADNSDLITDLEADDVIDLRGLDANAAKAGNQTFKLMTAFAGHAGQAVLSYDSAASETSLSLDDDGDGLTDMMIRLQGDHRDFAGLIL